MTRPMFLALISMLMTLMGCESHQDKRTKSDNSQLISADPSIRGNSDKDADAVGSQGDQEDGDDSDNSSDEDDNSSSDEDEDEEGDDSPEDEDKNKTGGSLVPPAKGDGYVEFEPATKTLVEEVVAAGESRDDCHTKNQTWMIDKSDPLAPAGVCGDPLAKVACTVENFNTYFAQMPVAEASWKNFVGVDIDAAFKLYDCGKTANGYSLLFLKAEVAGVVEYAVFQSIDIPIP